MLNNLKFKLTKKRSEKEYKHNLENGVDSLFMWLDTMIDVGNKISKLPSFSSLDSNRKENVSGINFSMQKCYSLKNSLCFIIEAALEDNILEKLSVKYFKHNSDALMYHYDIKVEDDSILSIIDNLKNKLKKLESTYDLLELDRSRGVELGENPISSNELLERLIEAMEELKPANMALSAYRSKNRYPPLSPTAYRRFLKKKLKFSTFDGLSRLQSLLRRKIEK